MTDLFSPRNTCFSDFTNNLGVLLFIMCTVIGTHNSLSAPVDDPLSRNLNTQSIRRKFVLKYLFTRPLITVLAEGRFVTMPGAG